MKAITEEWIAKAEADFATLLRESRVIDNPNYDAVCFHVQQCAEKYLKARFCEGGIMFGKVHDLIALLEESLSLEPSWEAFREDLAFLSDFAVTYRYPGESADAATAQEAKQRCVIFRESARQCFGL